MAVPQWPLSSFKLECWAGSILHSLISGIHLSRVSISCASHPKINLHYRGCTEVFLPSIQRNLRTVREGGLLNSMSFSFTSLIQIINLLPFDLDFIDPPPQRGNLCVTSAQVSVNKEMLYHVVNVKWPYKTHQEHCYT